MSEFDIDKDTATILIIDDEAVNIRLLEGMLRVAGYKNIIATQDPTEAAGLHQEYDSDLILLDLSMPLMDGYAVMKQLREKATNPLPPLLALTSPNAEECRRTALDSGARDYIAKPIDCHELLSRVQNLLHVQLAQKYVRQHNELLEQKAFERTQELHRANPQLHHGCLQVVRRLGKAAEYRDEQTGQHIIRMSEIAALLGQSMGMNDDEAKLLLHAAPMHDVGKIGIPDHILLKPGKLDQDEWQVMQTHAQLGADILDGGESDLISMARKIALTHHEKWDGSGYPNKLKGEKIPLVGRACALADVFDALTSKRPYKEAWTIKDAIALIKAQSGKHFDPTLVQRFVDVMPKVIAIKEKHTDPGARQVV